MGAVLSQGTPSVQVVALTALLFRAQIVGLYGFIIIGGSPQPFSLTLIYFQGCFGTNGTVTCKRAGYDDYNR